MNASFQRRDVLGLAAGLGAAGLAGGFGAALAAEAGVPDAGRRASDILDLLELHGRYSFGADIAKVADDYANVFTDDGAFIGLVGRGGRDEIRGREAILKFVGSVLAKPGKNVEWTTHHNQTCNTVFALDGDSALTRTYLLVTLTRNGEPIAPAVASEYEDRMVRTPKGWRIRERRAGLLPGLAVAAFAAPYPRIADAKESSMGASAFDRLEIMDVVARWSHAADGTERAALDRVMTGDAVFELAERGRPGDSVQGLDAIWARLGAGAERAREVRRHVRNTVVFESDGATATARSYYIVTAGERPPKLAIVATGVYTDSLVRTGEGWRIAHRKAEPDGTSADTPRA